MDSSERSRLIKSYGEAHSELIEGLSRFPRECWHFKPGSETWSIHEIIVHITDSEANSYTRCRRLIAEPGKDVMAYDEMRWSEKLAYHHQKAETAIELFKWLRKASYELIKDLPESTWKQTIYHPENGWMSLDDWLVVYERHVREHVAQMTDVFESWKAAGKG